MCVRRDGVTPYFVPFHAVGAIRFRSRGLVVSLRQFRHGLEMLMVVVSLTTLTSLARGSEYDSVMFSLTIH